MERQFFSGNTLEQAVLAAARYHDVDPDKVAYKLREKKHGFVNVRRRVVIEVDPAAPEQVDLPTSDRAAAVSGVVGENKNTRPGYGERERRGFQRASWRGEPIPWSGEGSEDETLAALETSINEVGELVGAELSTSIELNEDAYEIEIGGDDSRVLRSGRGSSLTAIEHLLPRMARGLSGRGALCRVDSEGFRASYDQKLDRLALEVAEVVKQEGRDQLLEPMNPAERRRIHMTLAEDPLVETESEGSGFLKRVRIAAR